MTTLAIVLVVVAFVGGFVFGVLFGRRNKNTVESTIGKIEKKF